MAMVRSTAGRARSRPKAARRSAGAGPGGPHHRRPHAVHVVAAVDAALVFHQAMHVGGEAGEAGVELARELQVLHDLAVEALARDQQRDARRVRRQQRGGDAAFQLVDVHPLGLAVGDVGKGIAGLHRRLQVRQVHLGGQPRDVALGIGLVHGLAQVLQAHLLVLRMGLAELGQDAPHRCVAVVVVLELLQRGEQRVPAALGDADGEQDEERIEARLLDHHAVLGQELGDDARRDAGGGELARHVQPGRDDGALDRVEQVEARRPGRRSHATCPWPSASRARRGQCRRRPACPGPRP